VPTTGSAADVLGRARGGDRVGIGACCPLAGQPLHVFGAAVRSIAQCRKNRPCAVRADETPHSSTFNQIWIGLKAHAPAMLRRGVVCIPLMRSGTRTWVPSPCRSGGWTAAQTAC